MEETAEILFDQPVPWMTPPENDIFLDSPRNHERRG
jgi:hypothetical protein